MSRSGRCAWGSFAARSTPLAWNITELAGTSGYGYSSNGDSELTSSTAGTYGYNTLGERTSLTPTTGTASSYGYNANQNLTQAAVPTTGTATATVNYGYDAAGQLQSSTTSGTTTPFTWDDTASTPNLLAAATSTTSTGPVETRSNKSQAPAQSNTSMKIRSAPPD